jgi:hypothetical protein
MATSSMEIVDTAIKIGLGALIAGVFSIALIFATLARDTFADRRTRRLRHIEDAIMAAERYLNFIIKHAATAAWFYSDDLDAASERQAKKNYDRSNAKLDDSLDDLNTATSRLMLVDYEAISELLRDASNRAYKLLGKIEAGGSYEEQDKKFEAFRTDLGAKRREIMRMLREAYQK